MDNIYLFFLGWVNKGDNRFIIICIDVDFSMCWYWIIDSSLILNIFIYIKIG